MRRFSYAGIKAAAGGLGGVKRQVGAFDQILEVPVGGFICPSGASETCRHLENIAARQGDFRRLDRQPHTLGNDRSIVRRRIR